MDSVFLEAGRKRDHQLNKAALHLRLLNNKAVGKVFSSLRNINVELQSVIFVAGSKRLTERLKYLAAWAKPKG